MHPAKSGTTMNKAFPYCRHSTNLQATSTQIQREEIRRYYDYKLAPLGIEWVEPHVDAAISGTSNFLDREAGRKLDHLAERGDHIIVSKLDRGFRSARDFLTMYECWRARGITLHMLDISVDSSTPFGKFALGVIALVAEWERTRIIERLTAGNEAGKRRKVARGLPDVGSKVLPYGFKTIGERPNKKWGRDKDERAHMKQMLIWYEEGKTWQEIFVLLRKGCMFRRTNRSATGNVEYRGGYSVVLWRGPLMMTTQWVGERPKCEIQRAVEAEIRLQAWEKEDKSDEWIARTLWLEMLARREQKIFKKKAKIALAKDLRTGYIGSNGDGEK